MPLRLAESGQAAIEYILLLLISVTIILSLFTQFNRAFRTYAVNYFGKYVTCLLEVGELPGVAGICQSEFVAFDPAATGPNGESGGGANGAGGSKDKKDSKSQSSAKGGSKSGGSGGETGGSTSRSSVGSFGREFGQSKQRSTPVGSISKGSEGSGSEADALLGVPSSSRISIGTLAQKDQARAKVFSTGFMTIDEYQPIDDRPPVAPAGKAPAGNAGLRPKKVALKVTTTPTKQIEVEDKELTFGGMMRMLLIAAIVVIILVFFGGQALQISKSMEK
jgi:hypothetical protein